MKMNDVSDVVSTNCCRDFRKAHKTQLKVKNFCSKAKSKGKPRELEGHGRSLCINMLRSAITSLSDRERACTVNERKL